MSRLGVAIILALLLSPFPAHAEVWRCNQAGGTVLFTDTLFDSQACQRYEFGRDFNTVPSSATTTLPDLAPNQPMPVVAPSAPPETRREGWEPYTPTADEQEPYDYLYPYPGDYWIPFTLFAPRHQHHHHQRLSSHHVAAHTSGHGGGHGGHR